MEKLKNSLDPTKKTAMAYRLEGKNRVLFALNDSWPKTLLMDPSVFVRVQRMVAEQPQSILVAPSHLVPWLLAFHLFIGVFHLAC